MSKPTTKQRRTKKNIDYPLEGLRLLARYHYLTTKQLVALDFCASQTTAAAIMARNMAGNRPFCRKVDYPPSPVRGRLHSVYYLTKYGATRVIEELRLDPERVTYPKGKPPRLQDYWHRLAMIDFQIEVDKFAQRHSAELGFFHTYFDKQGANRGTPQGGRLRALSKIEIGKEFYLIPDGVFLINAPDGRQYLFAVEVYNGRDTKRVLRQLGKHAYLLDQGAVAAQYDLALPWRVLSIFEDKAAMKAVLNRAAALPELEAFTEYFAFSTLDMVRVDFARNWYNLSTLKGSIFRACN